MHVSVPPVRMLKGVPKQLRRRHHTVPASYLARFAKNGELRRVPLDGAPHRLQVKDATVIRDFYMTKDPDGLPSDVFEEAFGDLEGRAAESFRQVVDDAIWPIQDETRIGIAAWAALQYLRPEAIRTRNNEMADALLKLTVAVGGREQIRAMGRELDGREPTDEEVDESWRMLTDFESYTITPSAEHHLSTIQDMLMPVTGMFFDRGWTIIRFTRKTLATCDTPVMLVRQPFSDPNRGVGLKTAGAILLPLDRRVALMMGSRESPDFQKPGTTALAWDINQRIANAARRAVYHHPDDDPLRGVELPPRRDREMIIPDIGGSVRE